jgi:hypothetical protein
MKTGGTVQICAPAEEALFYWKKPNELNYEVLPI